MKVQRIASWLGSLLFITIVFGCAPPVQSTPTLSLVTPTILTAMTISAKTALPTLTSSPASTPSPATPTDIPTLPVEDARQRLLTLLANNNDCRLPCLWGISPGKTSYLDARSILLPLRGIAETAYFDPASPDSISPFYLEDSQRLYTGIIYLYNANGVISLIGLQSMEQQLSKDQYGNQLTTPIFDSPTFLKRVQYYSLSHVLSEQGMPDSIMVQTYGELVGGTMDIALLYPERGIWANYTMVTFSSTGIAKRGCPANASINMFLVPPGNPDAFFSSLDETNWGATKVGYKPLDEATSMSIDQFYETFRQPTDECIETPSNLWPTPER